MEISGNKWTKTQAEKIWH